MTMQNVISSRQISITEADFDRLRTLVESSHYRATHSASVTTLSEELEQGKVINSRKIPKGVVTMHSKVRVRDREEDETEEYTLVYPEQADINDGKLSVLAPLGMALLGAKVGQVVRFEAPAGPRRLKVEKILYQPEAAGDLHL